MKSPLCFILLSTLAIYSAQAGCSNAFGCNPIDNPCCGNCVNFGCVPTPIQQNCLDSTIEETEDFIAGIFEGGFKSLVGPAVSFLEMPTEFAEAWEAWGNVQWSQGGAGLLTAITDTVSAFQSVIDNLATEFGGKEVVDAACTAFVATIAPEAVLTFEASEWILTVGLHKFDVTSDILQIYNGFSSKDYNQAGQGLGSLIVDLIGDGNSGEGGKTTESY